jgi:FkbM family methyltransferase
MLKFENGNERIYIKIFEKEHQEKLLKIHNDIIINHGNKYDEYLEQLLSVMFIKPDDCVLEIGGNIGRNSCVIGKLLNDSNNLLVVESDPLSIPKLEENKNINSLNFKIEGFAISRIPLIQKEWITEPQVNNLVPEDWAIVKTITWDDLKQKYNMNFNVLVLDCDIIY